MVMDMACTVRKLGYGFIFASYSNYGSTLYHFRDKTRYWSKIAISSPSFQGHFDAEYQMS